jgi:hypothetical protein
MVGRGQETPENHPIIVLRGFFYRFVVYMDNENEKCYYVVEVIEHG